MRNLNDSSNHEALFLFVTNSFVGYVLTVTVNNYSIKERSSFVTMNNNKSDIFIFITKILHNYLSAQHVSMILLSMESTLCHVLQKLIYLAK